MHVAGGEDLVAILHGDHRFQPAHIHRMVQRILGLMLMVFSLTMLPPIGVGFYVACRIGDAPPDDVMGAIWPYIAALVVGLVVIAAVPWISTVAL